MNTIRLGVIGAGVLGSYHLEKCCKHSHAVCSGIYDQIHSLAIEKASRHNCTAFASVAELLANSDAIIVATPARTHHEVAMECLRAGKHVLIEKPLAASVAEGEEIVETARKMGCVVHVGHSEAFNPAIIKLHEFAPAPQFIEVHRLAAFSPRGTDVSVVLDLMVHDIHLVLRFCKELPDPEKSLATGVAIVSNDIDIVNARLMFPSGCVANMTASRISAKKMRKFRMFQKSGYFSADLDKREVVRCWLTQPSQQESGPIGMSTSIAEPSDALSAEQEAFLSAISGVPSVPGCGGTSGSEALNVLIVCEMILNQIQKR